MCKATGNNVWKTGKHVTLIVIFLVLLQNTVRSQSMLTGQVTGAQNKRLAYVSVVLLRDSAFLTGTATDEAGRFSLLHRWEQQTTYTLQLSLIGYQSLSVNFTYPDTTVINHLVLKQDQHTLAGVTVTAKAPLVTRKADRYIVNVENSFLADGNTGLEVLQKSPGIWVYPNGSIRISGSHPAVVMVNDVLLRMPADELAIYLSTLKSEDISSIEVIRNPPAEYEASGSGGIIHIILKKNRKRGLNGAIHAQYRYRGKQPRISTGYTMNVKLKNIYLDAGYTFIKDIRSMKETADISYPDKSIYRNYSDRGEDYTNHQYRLGITGDISARQLISIQTIQSRSDFPQFFHSDISYNTGSTLITGITLTDKDRLFRYGSTTLNYSWKPDTLGSGLKIIANYTNNNKAESQLNNEWYSDSIPNATYRYEMPFVTDIYSALADYTHVFRNKTTLKGGIKYASIRRDNTIQREDSTGSGWVINEAAGNRFIYTENLLMFHASVEKKIRRITVKAGLRAEETRSIGNSITPAQRFYRKYFGLFPSLYVLHAFNEKKGNFLYLNYSRRLSRPSLRDLNPYRFRYNNYTSLTGNPDLLPQYTHSIGGGYILLNDYSADVYIKKTVNIIALSANPGPGNSIDYISENVNSSMEYGLDVNAPFTVVKGWTTINNFSVAHLSYTFNDQKTTQTSFSVKSINTISIKKFADLDVVAEYRSPYRYTNIYNLYSFYADAGISKKILKGKGRMRLTFSDIFNTLREKEITDASHTRIVFYRKRQTRAVQLAFTYNFNAGKKFKGNKIEEGNQEEKSRAGS